MRVVRAFRFPITVIMTALALSGCMRTTGPVAVAPQSDLDAMTYGQTYAPAPVAVSATPNATAFAPVAATSRPMATALRPDAVDWRPVAMAFAPDISRYSEWAANHLWS